MSLLSYFSHLDWSYNLLLWCKRHRACSDHQTEGLCLFYHSLCESRKLTVWESQFSLLQSKRQSRERPHLSQPVQSKSLWTSQPSKNWKIFTNARGNLNQKRKKNQKHQLAKSIQTAELHNFELKAVIIVLGTVWVLFFFLLVKTNS